MEHRIFLKVLELMEISLTLPRDTALQELKVALHILLPSMIQHERIEEQILFPAFRKAGVRNDSAVAAFSESHKEIWRTLNFLRDAVEEEGADHQR